MPNGINTTFNSEAARYEIELIGDVIGGKYFVTEYGVFSTEQGLTVNSAIRGLLMFGIQTAFGQARDHKNQVERIFEAFRTQAIASCISGARSLSKP